MNSFVKFLGGLGFPEYAVLPIIFGALFLSIFILSPTLGLTILVWIASISPIWLPILLLVLFWHLWVQYIQAEFLAKQKMVMLEIVVPRDIDKSPKAMEAVFDGIHLGPGESTFIDRWWYGKTRPFWSFEIASIEGDIKFFVRTREFFREYVEAQIYAQYPEVEIHEAEDYAMRTTYSPSQHTIMGCDFQLTGADPLPIKTYIDYGLDKDPKEEYKVDPSAQIYEHLSTLGKGEQLWIQVIIRTNKDEIKKGGFFGKKEKKWKSEAQDLMDKIKESAMVEMDALTDPDKKVKGLGPLRPADREKMEAIDRSMGKNGFDVGMRGLYIADKGAFKPIRFVGMIGMFKQFGSANLNGIAPTRWHAKFDFFWQEWFGAIEKASQGVFDAYRKRSWFFPPYRTPYFVLTSEELATIYHFPGRTVQAPGLRRIPAKKSEAPANLPI